MKTRTGGFEIGLRRGFAGWHKDLGELIGWMKNNNLHVLDLGKDGASAAKQVTESGLRIGSIDLPDWQGLMAKDAAKRQDAVARTKEYIEDCSKVSGPLNFFVVMLPEDPALPRSENFGYMVESYSALAPVLEKCQSAIVIEGWPGPGALCCTPETLRAFFEKVPSRSMGFNYDPSHLIRMGIDPIRFLKEFGDRVYHIHGKDTELIPEAQYEYGRLQPSTFAKRVMFGDTYWRYTIPGHGVMRWIEAFRILERFAYKGAISIELEDANFAAGDEGTKAGYLFGAQYLSGC